MKIIRTHAAIELSDNIRLLPHNGYVLPDGVADSVASELLKSVGRCGMTISHFNSYERRYAGQPLGKKSLLIYRHAAFGDTLICTALVAYIRHLNPDAMIDVYTHPQNVGLYEGVGCRTYSGFPTLDAAKHYDYHLCFEYMLENNSEPDQRNCYDDMFAYAGYDPETVPVEFKRPHLKYSGPDNPGTHIVYHIWASNPNRCYPPEKSNILLDCLRREFPNRELMIVGKDDHGFFKEFPRWLPFHHKTTSFKDLTPVVAQAALVICPDSSVGHLAAVFTRVPVISLWGLFHPDDRVKYYPNHHALTAFSVCPHAPCRVHSFDLPQNWCRDAVNAMPGIQEHCCVLHAIPPETIVQKAKELLSVTARHAGDMRFLVLTASNGKRPDLVELTHGLNREYCHRHGIDYARESIPDDYDRHPSWYKLNLLQRFLPEYDFVLWVDDDAALVGAADIRDIIRQCTLNIAVDHNGINCGVMAWRNCPEAHAALARLQNSFERFALHKWFEQAALMEFVDSLDVHYQDKSAWNAYPNDATPASLVRHWPGMEHNDRLAAIRSYIKGRDLVGK